MPFSACIMIIAPLSAAVCMARRICAVVGVEDARVGHEQLEAGDALVDQLVHRLERVVVDAADDLVEAVVDRAVARRPWRARPRARPARARRCAARRSRRSSSCRPRPRRGCRSRRCRRRRCRRRAAPCACARRCRRGSTYLPVASITVSAVAARSTPSSVEPGARTRDDASRRRRARRPAARPVARDDGAAA